MAANSTYRYWRRASNIKSWLKAPLLALTLFTGSAAAALDFERAAGVIGILPLPEVFGHEPCAPFQSRPVALYPAPHTATPVGQIYLTKPYTFPPEGGCTGLEVAVALEQPERRNEALPTLEFSYENPGAIVVKREGAWFQIALAQGYGWVHVEDPARYLPVEQLLKGSLAHLQQDDVTLVSVPAGDEVVWHTPVNAPAHLPVEVLGFRELGGVLWLEIKLLEVELCTDEKTGVEPVTGWLPLHDAAGLPAVWFSPRGC